MTFKSKLFIVLAVALMLVAAGVWYQYVYKPAQLEEMMQASVLSRVVNEDLSFEFAFTGGPNDYTYTQAAPELLEGSPLLQAYVIMHTETQAAYLEEGGGETPPAISVLVFSRDAEAVLPEVNAAGEKLSVTEKITEWAKINNAFTNINLATSPVQELKIDGAPAIQYTTEGLYPQNVYLIKYTDKYYLFVGQSDGANDPIANEFARVINSIVFY